MQLVPTMLVVQVDQEDPVQTLPLPVLVHTMVVVVAAAVKLPLPQVVWVVVELALFPPITQRPEHQIPVAVAEVHEMRQIVQMYTRVLVVLV